MIEPTALPEAARRKYNTLRLAADDAHALSDLARKNVAETEGALAELRNKWNASVDPAKPDRALAAEIERAAEHVVEVQMQQRLRFEKYQSATRLNAELRDFLSNLPRDRAISTVTVRPTVEGSPREHVDRLRQRIAALQSELERVRTAPAHLDDAKRQVRNMVEGWAKMGRPAMATQGGELLIRAFDPHALRGPASMSDVAFLLAWLDPDKFAAKLTAELERLPTDPNALPPEQRERRVRELETDILALEREEEAVIEAALATQAALIERRVDCDPRAVLGIKVATPGEAVLEAAE